MALNSASRVTKNSVLQQSVVLPQHHFFDVAVPSQEVIIVLLFCY